MSIFGATVLTGAAADWHGGRLDPALPASSLADEKWGFRVLALRRTYRVG